MESVSTGGGRFQESSTRQLEIVSTTVRLTGGGGGAVRERERERERERGGGGG